ncbi:hypothetical protein DL95DRAFT_409876 [Leptodontidium sp. 2 PMI_412]|nr:hypothetical protein DL95DRAFT_409876 [Leptodontidium sp. 2 PMI_412]
MPRSPRPKVLAPRTFEVFQKYTFPPPPKSVLHKHQRTTTTPQTPPPDLLLRSTSTGLLASFAPTETLLKFYLYFSALEIFFIPHNLPPRRTAPHLIATMPPKKGNKGENEEKKTMLLSLWALPLFPSADAPSAFIPTAATAAGEESVVDSSSPGPEVSGEQPSASSRSVRHPMTFTDTTAEQAAAVQSRAEKDKKVSDDKVAKKPQYKAPPKIKPGHPLFEEYKRIPLGGTGEELTLRQRIMLAIVKDEKAAYHRASKYYSSKNGLILSRFRPDRPNPEVNDEFSDEKITDALLKEVGMTRAHLRYASGGKPNKNEKLVDYDVRWTGEAREESK